MASQESIAFLEAVVGRPSGDAGCPCEIGEERKKTAGQSGAEESGKVLVRVIALQEETQEQFAASGARDGVPLKTVLLAAHMKAMQVLSGQSDLNHWSDAQRAPGSGGRRADSWTVLNNGSVSAEARERQLETTDSETFAAEHADRAAPPLSDGGSAGTDGWGSVV